MIRATTFGLFALVLTATAPPVRAQQVPVAHAVACSPVAATQMAGNTLDLMGSTLCAPTADLPAFGSTNASCALTGQAEPYQEHLFHVDTDASYTVSVTEAIDIGSGDDTVLLLFHTQFDPGSGCTNFVAVGNETPGSGLTATLSSADTYALVVAGFLGSEDDYTVRITGPTGSQVISGALPVELVRFEAIQDGGDLVLAWTTASETNNAGFAVEQQAPDATWHEQRFVGGAGTTAEMTQYTERFPAPEPGTYRFRLRQVDFDGTHTYSAEVEVAVVLTEAFRLSRPLPHPSTGLTRLSLAVRDPQAVRVAVYDAVGREVAVLFDAPLGTSSAQTLTFDTAAWPAGLYLVRATGERFRATQPLMVVR